MLNAKIYVNKHFHVVILLTIYSKYVQK